MAKRALKKKSLALRIAEKLDEIGRLEKAAAKERRTHLGSPRAILITALIAATEELFMLQDKNHNTLSYEIQNKPPIPQ